MALPFHESVDDFATFGADSAEVTQTRLNSNFDIAVANDQGVQNSFENALYDVLGSGVLSGMEPTIPVYGGLSIDVAAGIALIGYSMEFVAAGVAITASMDPGYLYLRQDGLFHDAGGTATPPAGVSSVLFATYTSDGYDSLTVTQQNFGVLPGVIRAGVAGAVSAGVIRTTIAERDMWIEDVQIVLGNTGTYANTTVDVHVGDAGATPPTIFTTQGNRPSIASLTDVYSTDTSGTPEANRLVTEGQVIVIEVDEAATGAEDLGVIIRYRYCAI